MTKCRVCRCTELEACDPPCSWVEADLCSLCAFTIQTLGAWEACAHKANQTALFREVRKLRALRRMWPARPRHQKMRGSA